MFDVDALETAGFQKTMTTEEWETWSESEAARYNKRPEGPTGKVLKNYRLERDGVILTTEQNTQSSSTTGIQTTVQYPEICVIEREDHTRSVTCDAGDTELILVLAEEIAKGA